VLTQYPEVTLANGIGLLSQAAAEFWVQCAAESTAHRDRFVIALCGGTTPRRLYELLASPPWKARVDWDRCHIFWGDERLVPLTDPDSNYLLAKTALLDQVPIPACQIYSVPTDLGDPATVASSYEATIRRLFGPADDRPRFDLLLLGLGSDGHVASLFPGSPALDETQRLVVSSPPGRLPPAVNRVTMTLPVFNAGRSVAFLVSGAEKARALQRALSRDDMIPAGRIKPVDGVLRWFVDRAAARALSENA
jgi:6-phosphogluconolactonase